MRSINLGTRHLRRSICLPSINRSHNNYDNNRTCGIQKSFDSSIHISHVVNIMETLTQFEQLPHNYFTIVMIIYTHVADIYVLIIFQLEHTYYVGNVGIEFCSSYIHLPRYVLHTEMVDSLFFILKKKNGIICCHYQSFFI